MTRAEKNLTPREKELVALMKSGKYTTVQQIAEAMGGCSQQNIYGLRKAVLKKRPELKEVLSFGATENKTKKKKSTKYSPRQAEFIKLRFSGDYSSIQKIADQMGVSPRYIRHDIVTAIVKRGEYTRAQLMFHPRKAPKTKTTKSKIEEKTIMHPVAEQLRQLLELCCTPAYQIPKSVEKEIPCTYEVSTAITGETPEKRAEFIMQKLQALSNERAKRQAGIDSIAAAASEYSNQIKSAIATISSIAERIIAGTEEANKSYTVLQTIDDAYLTLSEELTKIQTEIEESKATKITFDESCASDDEIQFVDVSSFDKKYAQMYLMWMLYESPEDVQTLWSYTKVDNLKLIADYLSVINAIAKEGKTSLKVYFTKKSGVAKIMKAYFSLPADKRLTGEVQYTATVEISN